MQKYDLGLISTRARYLPIIICVTSVIGNSRCKKYTHCGGSLNVKIINSILSINVFLIYFPQKTKLCRSFYKNSKINSFHLPRRLLFRLRYGLTDLRVFSISVWNLILIYVAILGRNINCCLFLGWKWRWDPAQFK